MQNTNVYDSTFWESRDTVAIDSARHCVPIVINALSPRSVIDMGCGRGHWLKIFAENRVDDICGVDGRWVRDHSSLLIPDGQFIEHDLSAPFSAGRRFDLAMSLEVAEHLPPSAGRQFVDSLTELSDVVLFSAAVSHQGGVGHLNERWSWYWSAAFEKRGFVQYDPFRRQLWHERSVAIWYRQNMFLYIKRGAAERLHEALARYRDCDLTLMPAATFYKLTRGAFLKRASRWLFGK